MAKPSRRPAPEPVPTAPAPPPAPSAAEVARRAYTLWIERGGEHGHDVEDWLRAQEELRQERAEAAPGGPTP